MHRPFSVLSVVVLAGLLGACATTRFETTWHDPEASFGKLDNVKVAAFLISEDESKRRAVESALARIVTQRGGRGVAGFRVLSGKEAQDEAVVVQKLEESGVEAVITMRIVSEADVTTTTPGTWYEMPAYRSWGGYWYPSWRSVYDPGYTFTSTVLKVETLIYDLESEKLIWAGLSRTTDPGGADELVEEIASRIGREFSKAGLIR